MPYPIQSISAVTLATHDMARAVDFYTQLGLRVRYGGPQADFTSLDAGQSCLNLIAVGDDRQWGWWGRVILYTPEVDALHRRALEAGLRPSSAPADADWGERYFHITDPDDHELSFAWPLAGKQA